MEAFRHARDRLRGEAPDRTGERARQIGVSATTLWRLARPEAEVPSNAFSGVMQERLIAYVAGDDEAAPNLSLHEMIAARLGQGPMESGLAVGRFGGNYHLFARERVSGAFTEARLRIGDPDGRPHFERRFPGLPEGEIEDSGLVFFEDGRLFFLGMAERAISLMIVRAIDRNKPMVGVQLSTSNDWESLPRARRVILQFQGNVDAFQPAQDAASLFDPALFDKLTDGPDSFLRQLF